jgi:hypothetical protein
MKIIAILLIGFIAQFAQAETGPPMTKIEYRGISPKRLPGSFGAKPVVLYIAGTTYSRTEEQPDPEQGIHGLIVCAEPDIWMINLIGRKGQHIVDPGPTFVTHHNILDRQAPQVFSTLEFGKELEFFQSRHASKLKEQLIEGQSCQVSEFSHENIKVVLFVRSDTGKPFHLDVFKDDQVYFSIRYLNYQTGLPFDPALFTPPGDVTISEARPNNSR